MYKRIPDGEKLHARAAALAAEDELSDTKISQLCGITRRTLIRWKKQPAIRKKIDEHLRLIQLHSEVEMISERQKRVLHLDIRFQELQRLIQERQQPEGEGVPGGSSFVTFCDILNLSFRCPHIEPVVLYFYPKEKDMTQGCTIEG